MLSLSLQLLDLFVKLIYKLDKVVYKLLKWLIKHYLNDVLLYIERDWPTFQMRKDKHNYESQTMSSFETNLALELDIDWNNYIKYIL